MSTWVIGGIVSGMWSIFKSRPNVIVSTYPIASAHFIGYVLHKLTGIPWVVDLRDPMAQPGYPADITKRKLFKWIENKITKHASKVLLTAPGAKAFYQEKFPQVNESFWQLIPNGYDQVIFGDIAEQVELAKRENTKKILLHSGVIYPHERDPTAFFKAIAFLKSAGKISAEQIEIRLRATGHDNLYRPLIEKLAIDDIVSLSPPIDYKDALKEMFQVDGLLLMQSEGCNYQIPAKVYEYIRTCKPVLALTPAEGDSAKLLTNTGYPCVVTSLTDAEEIKRDLESYLHKFDELSAGFDETLVKQFSRQYHAASLEKLLKDLIV